MVLPIQKDHRYQGQSNENRCSSGTGMLLTDDAQQTITSVSELRINTTCARDDTLSSPVCLERTLSEKSFDEKDCFFLPFGGKHHHNKEKQHQDIVKVLAEKTCTWMEELEEKRRRESAEHRISQAILGLRAASERSNSSDSVLLQEGASSPLHELVGDVGVAMFSPLDKTAFEPQQRNNSCKEEEEKNTHHVESEKIEDTETDDESEEYYPVQIEDEPDADLISCPRLLTPTMMQQLVDDDALPEILKSKTWKRIFAIGRDGDAFCTMAQHCHSYKYSLVVAQTPEGHVFGGFATEPWTRRQDGVGRCFFGSGQSFLFTSFQDEQAESVGQDDGSDCFHDSNMNELAVYKWTGNNRYCQVCDVDNGLIAMGGGGAFGLTIEENFTRGGTGKCDTFGNPPLIPSRDERFDISNFEVYGFVSSSQSFSSGRGSPSL